jgi:hypothetical protein
MRGGCLSLPHAHRNIALDAAAREEALREYLKTSGLKISPQQLDLLVPAFDAAWTIVRKRLAPDQDQQGARDRLARAVVDLVLAGGMTNTDNITAAAVRRILA